MRLPGNHKQHLQVIHMEHFKNVEFQRIHSKVYDAVKKAKYGKIPVSEKLESFPPLEIKKQLLLKMVKPKEKGEISFVRMSRH